MTTPAQPDTGAEAAPDTGTAPASTDADETAATATEETDWKAEAEKYKALARKHEDRAKANRKALTDAQAAAKPADGELTADDLKAQLQEATSAREAAEQRAVELAYNDTVRSAAAKVGADPDALMDSQKFLNEVEEELGDDFDDDDLREAVTKVAKDFAKQGRFAAAPTGAARSGADIGGGPGGLRQVTETELAGMSPEQIVDAQNSGRLNSLLGIT